MNIPTLTIHVVVTDPEWFFYLRSQNAEECNFWSPGGLLFQSDSRNDLFLFKMKSPYNWIGGGGFFQRSVILPLSLAWETFDKMNGRESYSDFRKVILNYQKERQGPDPKIGCTLLSSCFFWSDDRGISTPKTFSSSIVRGKKYSVKDPEGAKLYRQVTERIQSLNSQLFFAEDEKNALRENERFGKSIEIRPRLGQRGFRIEVLEGYGRRCAMTGERTLPVLQAAHIKPYAEGGPHEMGNGLLLRSDLHILFDTGYLTVTDDYRIEVSGKIREEFTNGMEYYALHGRHLTNLPEKLEDCPGKDFLSWHQSNRFVG